MPPRNTHLHLDGTPPNGSHGLAHKVNIHLGGILFQFSQNLLNIHEVNNIKDSATTIFRSRLF